MPSKVEGKVRVFGGRGVLFVEEGLKAPPCGHEWASLQRDEQLEGEVSRLGTGFCVLVSGLGA